MVLIFLAYKGRALALLQKEEEKMSQAKQEQQQRNTEPVEDNQMETEGGEQIKEEFKQEEQQEQTGPMTIDQKKERLKLLREHCTTNGVDHFLDMDLEFQMECVTLAKDIAEATASSRNHVVSLCEANHLSPENRDLVCKLLRVQSKDEAELGNMIVAYTAANVECLKASDKVNAELRQEIAELKRQKEQREQETFNANAKRLRSPNISSTQQQQQSYSSPTQAPRQNWSPSTNTNNTNSQTASNSSRPQPKSMAQQFNLLKESKVVIPRVPLGNDMINKALNPQFNGYEPIKRYVAPSAGVYGLFQDLEAEVEQQYQQRRPAFSSNLQK